MKSVFFFNYSIGSLGIAEEDDFITRVFFSGEIDLPGFKKTKTPLIKNAATQLKEYFTGLRKNFDLPLLPKGTDFQRSVWNSLLTIPYGETRCYRDIAIQINNPNACRAVGMANNRNPIVIVIPCHRVIGQDGSLVGYGGGISIKQYLLELEDNNVGLV